MVVVRLVEPEDIDTVASRVTNGESEIGCSDLPIDETGLTAVQLESQEYVAILPPGSAPGRRVTSSCGYASPRTPSLSWTGTICR